MKDGVFVFPSWTNGLRVAAAVLAAILPVYAGSLVYFGLTPETVAVGYQPVQPVPFSHAKHVGELGMDCRYCHNTVEEAAHAAVPPTQTCINCHANILPNSTKLTPVHESHQSGEPIEWVRVHDLADYVYFNHAAHVNRGVSCVECHGRIDNMEVVWQTQPLSMGWCLSCHRDPGENLRPAEYITRLDLTAEEARQTAGVSIDDLLKDYKIKSPQYLQSCTVCHR